MKIGTPNSAKIYWVNTQFAKSLSGAMVNIAALSSDVSREQIQERKLNPSGCISTLRLHLHLFNAYEPRHDKTCLRGFPTRPDTNRPAQPQKLISFEESRDILLSKQRTTKVQTARMRRLICAFVVRIWHRHIFSWPGSYVDGKTTLIKF